MSSHADELEALGAHPMNGVPARKRLEEWLGAIRSESHVLMQHPEMLCQQLVNEHGGMPMAALARERLLAENRVWVERRGSARPRGDAASVAGLRGHPTRVLSVAFLPSSRAGQTELIVSGDQDGEVRVWDAATARELHRFRAHEREVRRIAVTAQGRCVLTGGGDSTVRVWDPESWSELRSLPVSWRTVHLSPSRSSQRVAIVDGGSSMQILDAVSGEARTVPTQNWISIGVVALAPDDSAAAIGCGDGLVFVLDLTTGQPRHKLSVQGETITGIAISPDGAWLAAGGAGGALVLFDAASGEGRSLGGHRDAITEIVFSADGAVLYSASHDETIRAWSVETASALASVRAHGERVSCLARNGDGARLISGGWDRALRIWDAGHLAGPGDAEGAGLGGHEDVVWAADGSGDGRRVVTAGWDHTLIDWDPQTCSPRRRMTGHADKVTAVAVSEEDGRAYSGGRDGEVKVWDLRSGRLLKTLGFGGYQGWVNAIALAPDLLIAGTERGILRAWRRKNLRKRWDRSTGMEGVRAIAVSPDGARLALGGFGEPDLRRAGFPRPGLVGIQAVSSETAQPLRADHVDAVSSVAFDPGGAWLFSAGWDGCLIRRHATTGEIVDRWESRRGPLYVTVASADGNWVLAGGFDKTLRLLDVGSGDDVARFHCRGEVRACCAWVQDGALEMAAGDSTGAVHFLRVHGIEAALAAVPLQREAAADASTQAGRPLRSPAAAPPAAPESEGKPKKKPWWKLRSR
jgi:WD40 repeat protein